MGPDTDGVKLFRPAHAAPRAIARFREPVRRRRSILGAADGGTAHFKVLDYTTAIIHPTRIPGQYMRALAGVWLTFAMPCSIVNSATAIRGSTSQIHPTKLTDLSL